ncbi:MAG: dienelactone hydrolase family protein [Kofleriaceae bacterium]|nr:dienelactone hydrolase family protein [Myxococcales bacterium]MCB9565044.1 dienelactone hydrolase family protein [Kofleriaceae bacterium]MCB9573785.1 dienelactone hydrolase family protein [Kofleriaceae bacterium]
MQPELVATAVGRRTIDVEYYRPEGDGPWPGVLLLHELFGLTSQVRADARHLAREGFLVMAPDLYTQGLRRYCMKFFFSSDALANRGGGEHVAEIHRLLDVLKAHPACNGRLGMIGMCLTGGFVLQMARRDDVLAPVVFHHSFGLRGSGLPDAQAAEIGHVVQGHFGGDDKVLCPRSRVEALSRQLGDRLDAHVYPGVGHGLRSQFRHTPQADEAWATTLRFFHEHLS